MADINPSAALDPHRCWALCTLKIFSKYVFKFLGICSGLQRAVIWKRDNTVKLAALPATHFTYRPACSCPSPFLTSLMITTMSLLEGTLHFHNQPTSVPISTKYLHSHICFPTTWLNCVHSYKFEWPRKWYGCKLYHSMMENRLMYKMLLVNYLLVRENKNKWNHCNYLITC